MSDSPKLADVPGRNELPAMQLKRLNQVLRVASKRPFYRDRLAYRDSLGQLALPLTSLAELSGLPILEKRDLVSATPREPALLFDLPREDYSRLHQTSGTHGHPMVVLDTAEDWRWWLGCWDYVLDAAKVTPGDTVLMAFSFGPFIGFWTANDSLVRRGALVVPSGGASSEGRLRMIDQHACTVVCCTPTYALHLANLAAEKGMDLRGSSVTRLIVAGEPGGSIASVRARIEEAWGATVIDHAGGSEIGAWGFGSHDGKGLYVIETEFVAEVLTIDEDRPMGVPVDDGQEGELVLTNLGRLGGPAIRYRTGDIVRPYRNHEQEVPFLWLEGGVLGRADDMVIVRGVNVFPSSIEAIIRETHPHAEFRITISRKAEMDQLAIEIEAGDDRAARLTSVLRERFPMRISVTGVAPAALPRFEAKAKRVVDLR